jgi:hypothetical protein
MHGDGHGAVGIPGSAGIAGDRDLRYDMDCAAEVNQLRLGNSGAELRPECRKKGAK